MVSKRTLLFIAGLVWLAAGVRFLVRCVTKFR